MNTVILVPRRRDGGHRDAVWDYCRARWDQYLGLPIFEGHHDADEGPFNRSAAVNRAAEAAGDWDVALVIDSDVMVNRTQALLAINGAYEGKVTWGHLRWRGFSDGWTDRLILRDRKDFGPELDRDEIDLYVERTNPVSWSCCIAIPRAVWDDMGGFDERFKGWGFEDMAFQSLVVGLYPWARVQGDVIHLWHPRSEERIVKGKGRITASPEYVTNARLGRRYMVAVRRDHGVTDRLTPTDAAEMVRDIANLRRDDAEYTEVARRHGLPDWTQWWPTLEELRDGAKEYRASGQAHVPRERAVTLIVHTGGKADRWPDRREYLRSSLSSLDESVSGPIIQRVIYSDWGNEVRPELDQIAAEHGMYVVGPERHSGYSPSRAAMWRYIARRAKGSYIFAVEDDFVYDRPVDLAPMIDTLDANPGLRQLALLRAAAYPREHEAGGVLQTLKQPASLRNDRPFPFMEHRDHFTANPSLFRRTLVEVPWPQGDSSERKFGDALLRDTNATFGYWGSGDPWITHIGAVRAGTSY